MKFPNRSYMQEIHYSRGTATDVPLDGYYYHANIKDALPQLLKNWEGKIQLIYLDPPYMTGQDFIFKQIIKRNASEINEPIIFRRHAYSDKWVGGLKEYLSMIRFVLECCYKLLRDDGSIYVHTDFRTSPYIRLLMDEIFGDKNILNEIIWHYKTGGRAKNRYSRKHDNILFYRKTKDFYFNIDAIGFYRGADKKNNMKTQISHDGKVFFSIKSNGREYRYYEDSKQYPSDVWDDISHLHQKDPERTGYDTQKPEKLLERIIKASSKPGDMVADFFAGSGTTLYVAQKLMRKWIGVDNSISSLHVCRKRLLGLKDHPGVSFLYDLVLRAMDNDVLEVDIRGNEDCEISITLLKYSNGHMAGNDNFAYLIDYWAVGYIIENKFYVSECSFREGCFLEIKKTLSIKRSCYSVGVYIIDVFDNHSLSIVGPQ